MNLFLRKSILFVAVFLVVFIISYFVFHKVVNCTTSFKLEKNTTKLIMGDSQSECSYNDLFIENTFNIADSGESYFYTYFKLKKIVEDNPQISKVYVEFSNNKLYKNEETKIWEKKYLKRLENYSSFIPIPEQLFLFRKSGYAFITPFLKAFNNNLIHLMKMKTSYNNSKFGGYFKLEDSKIAFINKHQDSLLNVFSNRSFFSVDEFKNTNTYYYLRKIITLCKQKNIEIILLRSPKNACYLMINSEEEFQKQLLEFQDISFIDLKDFQLNDADFRDCEHLNYNGAKKVSMYFNQTKI